MFCNILNLKKTFDINGSASDSLKIMHTIMSKVTGRCLLVVVIKWCWVVSNLKASNTPIGA